MIRPIPIFRFVFAAYFAKCGYWEHDGWKRLGNADRVSKPKFPNLALVVDNGADAGPQKPLWPCERGWELKMD